MDVSHFCCAQLAPGLVLTSLNLLSLGRLDGRKLKAPACPTGAQHALAAGLSSGRSWPRSHPRPQFAPKSETSSRPPELGPSQVVFLRFLRSHVSRAAQVSAFCAQAVSARLEPAICVFVIVG